MSNIQVEPRTIGEIIHHFRKIRGIPILDFCDAIHISKSKYTRVVRNESTLTMGQLYSVLDILEIQGPEFSMYLANDLWVESLALKVIKLCPNLTINPTNMQKIDTLLIELKDKLQTSSNTGVQQLIQYVESAQALNIDNNSTHGALLAEQLGAELCHYERWTTFEYRLFIPLIRVLPIKYSKFAMTHILVDFDRRNSSSSKMLETADCFQIASTDLAREFMKRAIKSKNRNFLLLTVDWILNQDIMSVIPSYVSYFHLSNAIKIVLSGKWHKYSDKYRQLATDWKIIYQNTPEDDTVLSDLWHDFLNTGFSSTSILDEQLDIPFQPNTLNWPNSTSTADTIDLTRQFKHMSIKDLTLCSGISRSSYQRFVHDNHQITSDAFFSMLNTLRLGEEELSMLLGTPEFKMNSRINEYNAVTLGAVSNKETLVSVLKDFHEKVMKWHTDKLGDTFYLRLAILITALSSSSDRNHTATQQNEYDKVFNLSAKTNLTGVDINLISMSSQGATQRIVKEKLHDIVYSNNLSTFSIRTKSPYNRFLIDSYVTALASVNPTLRDLDESITLLNTVSIFDCNVDRFNTYSVIAAERTTLTLGKHAGKEEIDNLIKATSNFFSDSNRFINSYYSLWNNFKKSPAYLNAPD